MDNICSICKHNGDAKKCCNCCRNYSDQWEDMIEVGSGIELPYLDCMGIVTHIEERNCERCAFILDGYGRADVNECKHVRPTGKVIKGIAAIMDELKDINAQEVLNV